MLEDDPRLREIFDVWRLDDPVPVGGQRPRAQLIGDKDQEVQAELSLNATQS
jgi:hypothetical protein